MLSLKPNRLGEAFKKKCTRKLGRIPSALSCQSESYYNIYNLGEVVYFVR
jgi:hypothetical protein